MTKCNTITNGTYDYPASSCSTLGTPVLAAARALGVDLDSVCGGRGICGRCQVRDADGLSPFSAVEERHAQKRPLAEGRRLGCCAQIDSDCVIDVPPESQVHRQVVRKAVEALDIEMNPSVRLFYVEVEEPDLHHPRSDLQRLFDALKREWALDLADADLDVLRRLQPTLRKGAWKVTCAVHLTEKAVIGVWPGFHDRLFGLAVDVGSTTIAADLVDLETGDVLSSVGRMNPQIRFGEDLMSRVSYIMMNPGGEKDLTATVIEALNDLARDAASAGGIAVSDILEITFVGNPIMHHLVLGIDPVELGGAPFALATDLPLSLRASEIGLALHPGARLFALPCIAGHVGADSAGVMLAERPDLSKELTLLVDVGTNAEIVLGDEKHLVACSSPTGPAFEGAQISSGQRAAPGAIERIRIDRDTLEPRFRVIGLELWSDDPGFDEALKEKGLKVSGLCGSGIIEVIAELFLSGVILSDGTIPGELAEKSPRVVADGKTFSYVLTDDLRVTQNDVRAIQLAKAALYAGVRLLMDRLGVDHVDRIRLAGAFGSHIDVKYAMVLGMLPDCDLDKVSSAGNAAGTGARRALLDSKSRLIIGELARRVEKIETAVEPAFQQHFVEAMALPHKTDPFLKLKSVVVLPEAAVGEAQLRGRRRPNRRHGPSEETIP